ncbi:MAG TPA: hypothetical protein PKE40_08015 [Arachnia sp.]|nr:hypothetical protein [Arachnia sp.]HMT86280.1 hypothetical protein [Arachnia sp.]
MNRTDRIVAARSTTEAAVDIPVENVGTPPPTAEAVAGSSGSA